MVTMPLSGNFMIIYILLKFSDLGSFSDTVHCKGLMHKCIKPMQYTLSKKSQYALNLYKRHLSEKLPILVCIKPMQYTLSEKLLICIKPM